MFSKMTYGLTAFLGFISCSLLFAQQPHEKQVQYLSGTDNEHTVTWDFWCTGGRKSGHWDTIQVPSQWEQQGFGAYNYGRDYVTYGKNFRFHDEKGIYRHSFKVNETWKGKKIFIVFEGVMTDAEVKINGQSAGPLHQGSFYRFKYDISDKVKYGQSNQLEVTVSKMSADKSVNNAERLADYWIFGGIFRPVYLEAVPETYIDWTSIDAPSDGRFRMQVHLGGNPKGMEVQAEILDSAGKVVGRSQHMINGKDTTVLLEAQVPSPALWSAEFPNRYQVHTRLYRAGTLVYQCTGKFGFRTIEIRKGDGIYLNGAKIKMKGVNRHVWWPESGRTVSPAIDLMDVQLIKYMNMNAVRCSHYPPDQSFLNICDSLGLYVLDELAGWQKAYSTPVGSKLVKEMVIRDANHPAIIFWSNGNEGGHNFDLDTLFGHYDYSKRPVIHAHHKPGNAFNGIDCNHYEDYYSTQQILADTNIYMPTEFLHAQDDGGGAAGLEDIWELHWNAKNGAGGFLWALLDEGIARTDENGQLDVNGINAPDGLVGPHREQEGSVAAIRAIYSPVKIRMKDLPADFKGDITVENRYHFTNLNQCTFRWSLINFDKPLQEGKGYTEKAQGRIDPPSISPLGQGVLHMDLPANWKDHEALVLMATDPHGKAIERWIWKVREQAELATHLFTEQGELAAALSEGDSTYTLTANGISVSINKKSGLLVHLANKNSKSLSFGNGPVLVKGNARPVSVKAYAEGDRQVVEATYTGNLRYIKWKMNPTGWLELDYAYALSGDYPFAGISFDYPESYVLGIKWLGQGPYRVWKNRLAGTTYQVWEKRYNDTQTGHVPWIYPEFKGYYADLTWMEMNTVEGKFYVASPMPDLYLRLFDFHGLSGPAAHPELPEGDISFLDAIPPIGTKLAFNVSANTQNLGPNSELNHLKGKEISRKLYFYFGLPNTTEHNKQFEMPKENILTDH